MPKRVTFICLKCTSNPEFDSYPEVFKHCKENHGGVLFIDTRERQK